MPIRQMELIGQVKIYHRLYLPTQQMQLLGMAPYGLLQVVLEQHEIQLRIHPMELIGQEQDIYFPLPLLGWQLLGMGLYGWQEVVHQALIHLRGVQMEHLGQFLQQARSQLDAQLLGMGLCG
jgi:hypothetical protein